MEEKKRKEKRVLKVGTWTFGRLKLRKKDRRSVPGIYIPDHNTTEHTHKHTQKTSEVKKEGETEKWRYWSIDAGPMSRGRQEMGPTSEGARGGDG